MTPKRFIVVVAVMLVGLTLGVGRLLASDTSCGSLAADGDYGVAAVEHTIAVELAGNTDDWMREVGSFVRAQLTRSGSIAPQEPLLVRFVFSRDGVLHKPVSECLRSPVALVPPAQDLVTFEAGSDQTRARMLENMAASRAARIATIVAEVEAEVAGTDFGDVGEDVELTVLPLWSAVSDRLDVLAGRRFVSLLSPLFSNAGDCLDGGDEAVPAGELVADCVEFSQLPVLTDAEVQVVFTRAVSPDAAQRRLAAELTDALCEHATANGCSAAGS